MTGDVKYTDETKVFPLTNRAVWGGSGSAQIIREIRRDLAGLVPELEASPNTAQSLVGRMRPILERHYASFLPNVPNVRPASPATSSLACGYTADGEPWIIEVDHYCAYAHYEERGFHAIGSGAGFAQMANALMAHFQTKDRPLSHGVLVAYRAIDAIIETKGAGIGGAIQMWVVSPTGVKELPPDELNEIRGQVAGWKEEERKALDQYLSPVAATEPTPMPAEVGGK